MAIIEQLEYSKVCALWVPRMLTVVYKETKIFCTNLTLEMRASWCIFAWGMRPGLTVRNHTLVVFDGMVASPKKKKFKRQLKKFWLQNFWYEKDVILENILPRGLQ